MYGTPHIKYMCLINAHKCFLINKHFLLMFLMVQCFLGKVNVLKDMDPLADLVLENKKSLERET